MSLGNPDDFPHHTCTPEHRQITGSAQSASLEVQATANRPPISVYCNLAVKPFNESSASSTNWPTSLALCRALEEPELNGSHLAGFGCSREWSCCGSANRQKVPRLWCLWHETCSNPCMRHTICDTQDLHVAFECVAHPPGLGYSQPLAEATSPLVSPGQPCRSVMTRNFLLVSTDLRAPTALAKRHHGALI